MNNSDFAKATGVLRVVEKKILSNEGMEKVLDASTPEEVLKSLTGNSSCDFSFLERGARAADYEKVLGEELVNTYRLIRKLSPSQELVEILEARYDFHNLKAALKAKILGKPAEDIYIEISLTSPEDIADAVNSGETKALPIHLGEAVTRLLAEELTDPQAIDMACDRELFDRMKVLAAQMEVEYISEYLAKTIDFHNIKALLRTKNMGKNLMFLKKALISGGLTDENLFLESYAKPEEAVTAHFYYKYFGSFYKRAMEQYEKDGNYAGLEKILDNSLMEVVKKSKYFAFGPEPLFAFILAKENEIRQIRIIMTCKLNNIPERVLRERLRDNYA